MLNRSLLLAAVILFTATAALAVWRGPPQMVAALDDETRDWVQALKNKDGGPCCDTADGFPVEVDGWDMAGIVDDTSGMILSEDSSARSVCEKSGTMDASFASQLQIEYFAVAQISTTG